MPAPALTRGDALAVLDRYLKARALADHAREMAVKFAVQLGDGATAESAKRMCERLERDADDARENVLRAMVGG